MTQLTGITTSTPGTGAAAEGSASSASVDYNAFLRLLVAQLKNQDPTQPMDSTQYLSQLASFSQVEQGIITNTKLDEMLTASAIEQANQLIGHTLTSADGNTSGKVLSVNITTNGLVAALDGGNTLAVGTGVVIS